MSTITRKQLSDRIANETENRKGAVEEVIKFFLDGIIEELEAGNRLEFRDFGVFEIVQREARKSRNPKTGEEISVPPKKFVSFKMGKKMRSLITGDRE